MKQCKRKCCDFLIGCIGQPNIKLYAQFMIRLVGKYMITIATKSRNAKKLIRAKTVLHVLDGVILTIRLTAKRLDKKPD